MSTTNWNSGKENWSFLLWDNFQRQFVALEYCLSCWEEHQSTQIFSQWWIRGVPIDWNSSSDSEDCQGRELLFGMQSSDHWSLATLSRVIFSSDWSTDPYCACCSFQPYSKNTSAGSSCYLRPFPELAFVTRNRPIFPSVSIFDLVYSW